MSLGLSLHILGCPELQRVCIFPFVQNVEGYEFLRRFYFLSQEGRNLIFEMHIVVFIVRTLSALQNAYCSCSKATQKIVTFLIMDYEY